MATPAHGMVSVYFTRDLIETKNKLIVGNLEACLEVGG